MGLNAKQLRELVVRPALTHLSMWSEAAENLVMGTAAQESRLQYLRQVKGPALGLWQVEPATHHDIWQNWLWNRPLVVGQIRQAAMVEIGAATPADELLIFNLRYAAIICRLIYRRRPEPLPDADDLPGLAAYWKKTYNTHLGKGKPEEFIANYAMVAA